MVPRLAASCSSGTEMFRILGENKGEHAANGQHDGSWANRKLFRSRIPLRKTGGMIPFVIEMRGKLKFPANKQCRLRSGLTSFLSADLNASRGHDLWTSCVQQGGFEGPENGPKQRRINNRLLSYRPQHRRGNVHNYLIVRWFSVLRNCDPAFIELANFFQHLLFATSVTALLCARLVTACIAAVVQHQEMRLRLVRDLRKLPCRGMKCLTVLLPFRRDLDR
jgi:hypothetical protein